MTFGERLRQLRDARGLSVGALAQAVGVTEGAIRQMESGQTKQASFAVGLRLARVLGVAPEILAGETPAISMLPAIVDPPQSLEDLVDLTALSTEVRLQAEWLVDLVGALQSHGIDLHSLRRPPGA